MPYLCTMNAEWWMLTCPLHWLTGLRCPFCGAQRMVLALWHGHMAEAFWLNPALFVAVPVGLAWWAWHRRNLTGREAFWLLVGALTWGVVRNIVGL